MKSFYDMCNMMNFGRFDDDTNGSIKNKLQTVSLNCTKTQKKRIAVINFCMNEKWQ